MPVTEAERHRLYESLKASLGDAEAETFMNLMPPADWTNLATKQDLAGLRADLQKTLGTWLFASQAAVIAAVALIVGLLS